MPSVRAPLSLDDQVYVVLRYERETSKFELCIPRTDGTYLLGDEAKTREYFVSVGHEALGGRAIDVARSFGTAMAILRENRAFAPDLLEIDPVTRRRDQEMTRERLFGDEDEEEVLQV